MTRRGEVSRLDTDHHEHEHLARAERRAEHADLPPGSVLFDPVRDPFLEPVLLAGEES